MIDPNNIVREYTDSELEELLIFTILVAGKTAKTIAPRAAVLHQYLQVTNNLDIDDLVAVMKRIGLGPYNKAQTIIEALRLDLRTCTIEDLEKIKGIGPKTAKAFIMWSRPNIQQAILDTHVLKWLKSQGVDNVPKSTPSRGPTYDRLEQEFLSRVPEGMTPAEFDLVIWRSYSEKTNS